MKYKSRMCRSTCGFVDATWCSAAVDLEAHADALLPGYGPDADVASQSLLGEEGVNLVCRVVVPLEDLKKGKIQKKTKNTYNYFWYFVTSTDTISYCHWNCCYCYTITTTATMTTNIIISITTATANIVTTTPPLMQ